MDDSRLFNSDLWWLVVVFVAMFIGTLIYDNGRRAERRRIAEEDAERERRRAEYQQEWDKLTDEQKEQFERAWRVPPR